MTMDQEYGNNMIEMLAKRAVSAMPSCEMCGGTLVGGSLTVSNDKGVPIIACIKCINISVQFFLRERTKRMAATTEV